MSPCPPPPAAVARVDAFRAGHHADHEAIHPELFGGTIATYGRLNREQGEMIAALRDEVRRLREDLRSLQKHSQDRPGGNR